MSAHHTVDAVPSTDVDAAEPQLDRDELVAAHQETKESNPLTNHAEPAEVASAPQGEMDVVPDVDLSERDGASSDGATVATESSPSDLQDELAVTSSANLNESPEASPEQTQPSAPSAAELQPEQSESGAGAVLAEPVEAEPAIAASEDGGLATDSPAETESTEPTAIEAVSEGEAIVEKAPPAPRPPVTAERVAALEAEVAGAPHKTYHLGKVRKALATNPDEALTERLHAIERDIDAQITERRAAKEAIIATAEAASTSNQWRVTGDSFKAMFDEWKAVGAAGRELDDQLWARFQAARTTFTQRRTAYFDERQQVWGANRATKESICAQAEAIQESSDWKATADAIKSLQAAWKEAGSAGRDADDALWARFNSAKQVFFDRRTLAWDAAREQKEALIAEAEAHKDSQDWRLAADAIKALQVRWKEVGAAGPAAEDQLWQRFRAATQGFFDRRNETFAERNREERDNLARKLALCEQAESLAYSTDALSASRAAKDLQAEWKATGPVPRAQSDALWGRFRAACDKIFGGATVERDRMQTEWQIRMKEALNRKREQITAIKESIAHDEANLERWRVTLSTLTPGGKSAEIEASLDAKILDVADRIRDKRQRIEELRESINDMEAKLKE